MSDLTKAERKVQEGTPIEHHDPFSCSFCGRDRIDDELFAYRHAIISGPDVFICRGCASDINLKICEAEGDPKASWIPKWPRTLPDDVKAVPPGHTKSMCCFCGKRREEVRHLYGALERQPRTRSRDRGSQVLDPDGKIPGIAICDECIALCIDIFVEGDEDEAKKKEGP